jgi:hypothetical protein
MIEFKRIWKEVVMASFRHYPGMFLERLREMMQNITQIVGAVAKN